MDSDRRTPLSRARGLGSAKEGLHHWWAQRITSLALIPLTVWFVAGVIHLAMGGEPYESFMSWIANPCNATLMILFLAVSFLLLKVCSSCRCPHRYGLSSGRYVEENARSASNAEWRSMCRIHRG